MGKLSFLDKIRILIETTKSSKLFIVVIGFLIFIAYVFFNINKKNKKTGKTIYILTYSLIFLFLITIYHSSLSKMFDYLVNNLFIAVYFPNLAIYLLALIITNIILWISIFNDKTTKVIKNINIIVFCLINYLLALLLSVINNQKLDIYLQESIYSNKNAQGLIELSSLIFIIWISFLIIYKLFYTYIKKSSKTKHPQLVLEKPKKKLPENIIETKIPSVVKEIKRENKFSNLNFQNTKTAEYEKLLTIDDYKILLKLLLEQRAKENKKKSDNPISIEQVEEKTEKEVISKSVINSEPIEVLTIEEDKKEQSIFDELKALYNINE